MKLLIVFIILLSVLALIAFRYRKQILAGWQIWRVLRQMKQKGTPQTKSGSKNSPQMKEVPLVRCEKCGKWISPENALKLKSEKFYCSSTCLEKAAKLQSLVD